MATQFTKRQILAAQASNKLAWPKFAQLVNIIRNNPFVPGGADT